MKHYEIKNTEPGVSSVKDVDTAKRRVKVAISRMGNKDLDGDVIDHGAYKRTIDTRGPKSANLIWHLTDHYASLKNAVGKFSELFVEGDYLVGVTDIPKTSWGNDVLEFYSTGHINQHSVGFRTIKSEPVNADTPDEYRLIKEIMLYEGSAVLWGANEDTPTLSVGKSANKEESEKNFFDTIKEINNLHKLFKSGHFSDTTFEFLEIQLAQKTQKLEQLFKVATQPADNPALDPVNEKEFSNVLTTFTNTLITENESRRIKTALSEFKATA